MEATITTAQNPAPFPKETIKSAIFEGRALIKDGKITVEATTVMFAKLKNADRETAVAAFNRLNVGNDKGGSSP
jgi:hypothetical protein